jgi:8-oxo-dGTP pyrophosphatase MutT (NUDIX family)
MIGITQSEENELNVLLTKRTSHLKHHAGEISLPGGSFDVSQDQDITMTALREAEEEIGLDRRSKRVDRVCFTAGQSRNWFHSDPNSQFDTQRFSTDDEQRRG